MEGQHGAAGEKSRAQPPVKPPQDFLFVDAAQAKASRQGRRNARSFVMQRARRERPWSTSKIVARQRKSSGSISPTSTGTSDSSRTPRFATPSPPILSHASHYFSRIHHEHHTSTKPEVCSECQASGQHDQGYCQHRLSTPLWLPVQNPHNALFDPFQTSSVDADYRVSELLDYFITHMAPGIIAVDVRDCSTLMKSQWFGMAMSNLGFMHSLLLTAAVHMYTVGRGSVDNILYYRAATIAAVNAAISIPDSHVAVSDANIGAVFNLLTVEESLRLPWFNQETLEEEQPNQRATHLDGLQRMIQIRGGLQGVASNRILQAFILWHSTAHAVASFDIPSPSTIEYITNANLPRHPIGYSPAISPHLIDYCRFAGVKDSLTDLVESVLILIADLNDWFDDLRSSLDPLDIQNFSCALECRLLAWLRVNEEYITPLEDALCVALLIFTIRTTEAMKRRSDIHLLHYAASNRLEKALNCTIRTEWQACPDVLLWILSIGAISAEGSTGSDWFAYQISLACAEFEIRSMEMLLERLQLCGWVSFKLNEAVSHLWNRVLNLRLEPYFEAPFRAEDADSPAGPLQNHVAAPDYVEWENMNWATLSFKDNVPGG